MAYLLTHFWPGGTIEQYQKTIAVVHPADGLPPGQVYHAAGCRLDRAPKALPRRRFSQIRDCRFDRPMKVKSVVAGICGAGVLLGVASVVVGA